MKLNRSRKANEMAKIEINRIIEQVEQLHNNNNWAGMNLHEMLNGITDDTANLKLPNFNHTIHQIARHLVTDYVVIKRLQGIDYELKDDEIWMPVEKINFKWNETVNAIIENKNRLIKEIQNLSDENLDKPILKDHVSVYENLHGYIQHSYYHFGQIAIMKKYIENINQ